MSTSVSIPKSLLADATNTTDPESVFCAATKANGTRCTNKAKADGACGMAAHKKAVAAMKLDDVAKPAPAQVEETQKVEEQPMEAEVSQDENVTPQEEDAGKLDMKWDVDALVEEQGQATTEEEDKAYEVADEEEEHEQVASSAVVSDIYKFKGKHTKFVYQGDALVDAVEVPPSEDIIQQTQRMEMSAADAATLAAAKTKSTGYLPAGSLDINKKSAGYKSFQ